jgi:hypothetical protein
MRHRLTVMTVVRVQDEGGGYSREDAATSTVWARITTVGALEANTYLQLQERVTHKALIRRAAVEQGQTVIWERPSSQGGDLALYVVSAVDADPDGRPGEFLELTLREGGNL